MNIGLNKFVCKIEKTRPDAVIPSKAHPSDVGYDLTLTDVVKQMGLVTLYTTGLIAEPPAGWSLDIAPRSSISKSGYLLAKSFGVVDPHYRGELLVALYKYDASAKDIVLPSKIVQLILRPLAPHCEMMEVSEVDKNTDRGSGGFGSSDNK